MTRIESEHHQVNNSQMEVFEFLQDLNNIEMLLPQDKISNWKSTSNDCSFKIQGTATISLVKANTTPNGKIMLESGEETPFPFELIVYIDEKESASEVYLIFEGDINAFLKMMVVKPLTNLFNYMAKRVNEAMNPAV